MTKRGVIHWDKVHRYVEACQHANMTKWTQPQLHPSMGPAFGGVTLRPMDTGKGGWDLFRPQADQERGQQLSLEDLLNIAADEDTYGGMPERKF